MKIETARLKIKKAFEDAETISDFKLRVYNILEDVYFDNGLISFPKDIKEGYELTKTGEIID